MKSDYTKKLLILVLVVGITAPAFIGSASPVNTTSSEIGPSQVIEPRESWFDAKWHKRFFLDLACDVDRRAGDIITFTLPPIPYLDINSLMVVYQGRQIPTEYNAAANQLIFVSPCDVPVGSNKRVTVYYDLMTNNLKEVNYVMPDWLPLDPNEPTLPPGVEEVDGHYYANGQQVYEVDGTWYYLDGTVVVNYLIIDHEGEEYSYVDAIGNTVLVYQDPVTFDWYLMDGTEIEANIIVNELDPALENNIYVLGNEYVYCVGGVWYYFDGTQVANQLYYLGQDGIYEGGSFTGGMIEGFLKGLDEVQTGTYSAVRATGHGQSVYVDGASQMVTQTVDAIAYRGHPNVKFQVRSDVTTVSTPFGMALINLDGELLYNDLRINRWNYETFLQDEFDADPLPPGEPEVSSTVKVISEAGPIDVDGLDFAGEGRLMASDTVHIYDQEHTYGVGDYLLVIPIFIQSRFIGLYDELTGYGGAIIFPDSTAVNNLLVEAWQRNIGGVTEYLINVGANYNYWWYEPEQGPLHTSIDGDLDVLLSYLYDLADVPSCITEILNRIGDHKGNRPLLRGSIHAWDNSLALKVKINSPVAREVIRGIAKLTIDIDVEGETLFEVFLKIGKNSRVKMDKVGTYRAHYDNDPSLEHDAVNCQYVGDVSSLGTGEMSVEVEAFDTNGTSVVAANLVYFWDNNTDTLFFAFLIGAASAVGALLGTFGASAFMKYQAKKGRKRTPMPSSSSGTSGTTFFKL
jgi:hypothetical protein